MKESAIEKALLTLHVTKETHFTSEKPKKYHVWSCHLLLDNFIQFGTKLYRQVVGISLREGGTLIFLYIPRLGSFLGVKILNFNIYGVFRKINILGGMKIL